MGIRRYRDISEVPPPQRVVDIEERIVRIAAVWERAHIRAAVDIPHGVVKFRTLEEAGKAREQRAQIRIEQLRQ
ncbi:MAG: hypothetical protein H0U74_12750 [Bradymonadaceae bacterium]|nr:hypothetical protein [Lujinxingiaceae bacterium]